MRELSAKTEFDLAPINSAQIDVARELAAVEKRELDRIETALERIRDGVYGTCDDCGNPISTARLRALPYATRCIKCQKMAEEVQLVQ